MRALLALLLLAAAFALGTWILGWWAVPLLGAAWGVMQRGRPRFATAFAAAALAWTLLLAWNAAGGAMGGLVTTLGGIFMMPGAALLAVTVLYGALLAACAAQVFGFAGRESATAT